ncbi:MAG: hypothetical protein R3F14_00895 [Polyangiaceae bacterium]
MEEVIATAQAAEVKIFELYTRPYSRPDTWFETKLAGGSFSQADQDRWHQQYDLVRSWHEKVTRATTQPQDRSIFFLENIFDFDWKPGDSPIPDGQWRPTSASTRAAPPQKGGVGQQSSLLRRLNAVVCNACSDCTALVIEPCFELSWGTAEERSHHRCLQVTPHHRPQLRQSGLNRVVILLIR